MFRIKSVRKSPYNGYNVLYCKDGHLYKKNISDVEKEELDLCGDLECKEAIMKKGIGSIDQRTDC